MQDNSDAKMTHSGGLKRSLSHGDDTHCIRKDELGFAAVTKIPGISLAKISKGSCSCSMRIVSQQEPGPLEPLPP